MRAVQPVLLGPKAELHCGIHESLQRHPPFGIRFVKRTPAHVFVVPREEDDADTIFENPHYGEFLDFGRGDEVAYSVSWPVLNRRAWVCEMDSFGFTAVFGRHILAPVARGNSYPFNVPGALATTRRRVALMLSAYSHPSCKAVLFYTRAERANIDRWLRQLNLEALAVSFLRKCVLVRPAADASSAARFNAKWTDKGPLHVVFCGMEFETKNGALALEVYERLLKAGPAIRLTYVGEIPPKWKSMYRATLRHVAHYPRLPRVQVLSLFDSAHVLFHPSLSESYGMVLVEAAAAGMMIVAARRKRLALSRELLDPDGGPLLEPDSVRPDEEGAWFAHAISLLASDRALSKQMARRNWESTKKGEFSMWHRNALLSSILRRAGNDFTSSGLMMSAVEGREKIALIRKSSQLFRREHRLYREKVGLVGRNIVL